MLLPSQWLLPACLLRGGGLGGCNHKFRSKIIVLYHIPGSGGSFMKADWRSKIIRVFKLKCRSLVKTVVELAGTGQGGRCEERVHERNVSRRRWVAMV